MKIREPFDFELQELPPGEWFCCAECKNIHDILEGLVSRGSELVEVDILNVIAKKRYQNEASYEQVIPQCQDFSWQLLHGRRGDPNNGKTLSEVAKIFSVRYYLLLVAVFYVYDVSFT